MRLAIFLLLLTFFAPKKSTILTGVVSIYNDPIRGCTIEVVENGATQTTDSEGNFRLIVNDLDKITLKVSYIDRYTCKIEITDIPMDKTEVDLGMIPLFFNETISVAEYEKLKSAQQKMYYENRHWATLIGYIHENRVDTSAVKTSLWDKAKIRYKIDSVNNKVIIAYKDWRK